MSVNPQQELEIVARARQGDRVALSHLVRAYSAKIYHLGLRLSGNRPVSYTHLTLPTILRV